MLQNKIVFLSLLLAQPVSGVLATQATIALLRYLFYSVSILQNGLTITSWRTDQNRR